MPFSVPLVLEVVDAVIYRLDTVGTRGFDPPGAATYGYNDAFREPVVFDETGGSSIADRKTSRAELSAIRVPCQVETAQYDSLRQSFQGTLNQSDMALVFHRVTLKTLGLIDEDTGNVLISVGDRVAALERHNFEGSVVLRLPGPEGLYITQVMPRSWGFGNDGYDLHVAILNPRDPGTV